MVFLYLRQIIFILPLLAIPAHAQEERPERRTAKDVKERCETTKEFITTLEYFRARKEIGIPEEMAIDTARQVSAGCTGAAERFVRTFELLMKTDAGPKSSLKVAVHLATKEEAYTDTFIAIFTRAFLAEYLDLDYNTAFDLAHRLAADYKGNPKIAEADFSKLVEFCMNDKFVGLSKPRCGVIAGRIVKKTERFQVLMAEEFITVFKFLVDENGPAASIAQAVDVAEIVVAQGPEAADNFISAYKYASTKDGLDMTAQSAVKFAVNLSQHTWDKVRGVASLPVPMPKTPTPADTEE